LWTEGYGEIAEPDRRAVFLELRSLCFSQFRAVGYGEVAEPDRCAAFLELLRPPNLVFALAAQRLCHRALARLEDIP